MPAIDTTVRSVVQQLESGAEDADSEVRGIDSRLRPSARRSAEAALAATAILCAGLAITRLSWDSRSSRLSPRGLGGSESRGAHAVEEAELLVKAPPATPPQPASPPPMPTYRQAQAVHAYYSRQSDSSAAAQLGGRDGDTSEVLGMMITGVGKHADEEDFSAYEYDEDEDGVPLDAPSL